MAGSQPMRLAMLPLDLQEACGLSRGVEAAATDGGLQRRSRWGVGLSGAGR